MTAEVRNELIKLLQDTLRPEELGRLMLLDDGLAIIPGMIRPWEASAPDAWFLEAVAAVERQGMVADLFRRWEAFRPRRKAEIDALARQILGPDWRAPITNCADIVVTREAMTAQVWRDGFAEGADLRLPTASPLRVQVLGIEIGLRVDDLQVEVTLRSEQGWLGLPFSVRIGGVVTRGKFKGARFRNSLPQVAVVHGMLQT